MIERSPQPARGLLAANKRPHLVHFSLLSLTNYYCRGSSLTMSHKSGIHLAEIVRFFLSVGDDRCRAYAQHASGIADATAGGVLDMEVMVHKLLIV
jgi:hypothetical protein